MNKKETKVTMNVLPGSYGVMPRDLNVEEAVLGAILIESETARKYMAHVEPDYFYDPRNKLIFNACMELYKKNKAVDILTVADQLREDGTLEDAGGPYNVTQMSGKVVSSAHIQTHILILSELYLRRRLAEVTMKCTAAAMDETADIDTTLVEMQQTLSTLAQKLPAVKAVREMSEVLDSVMNELDERMANGGCQLTGIDTGFPPLNELLLGWNKSSLNAIAARPGEGKTALLIYSMLHAARQGVPTVVISLESRAENLTERILIGETGIDPYDWRKGKLDAGQREKVEQARLELKDLPLRIFDSGYITIEEACVLIKSLHAEGKCELVGIDYMQLFNESKNSGNREQEVAKNSRMLKLLAMNLDIPVVLLCQLNREVMNNDKQIPRLENIRESGSIEQDGDTVTLLFHPAKAKMATTPESNYPVTPDMQMLIVAKNRNGTPGTVYLSHNPSMTRFCEYAPDADWLKHLPPAASSVSGGNKAGEWRLHDASFQAYLKEKQEKIENDGKLPF